MANRLPGAALTSALLFTGAACAGERPYYEEDPLVYEFSFEDIADEGVDDVADVSVKNPILTIDLSTIDELDPIVRDRVSQAIVQITIPLDDSYAEWIGTGFVIDDSSAAADIAITAGHVLTIREGDSEVSPQCGKIFINETRDPEHIKSNPLSRAVYDGHLQDVGSVLINENSVNELPIEIEASEQNSVNLGDTLYIVAPKDGRDSGVLVDFPGVVIDKSETGFRLVTGIGETLDDDPLGGMSGSPVVKADGTVIGVLVGTGLFGKMEGSDFTFWDSINETHGDIEIVGTSPDAEEIHMGTITNFLGYESTDTKGFTEAFVDIIPAELALTPNQFPIDCSEPEIFS